MVYNKIELIECKRCKDEIGWMNYLSEWQVFANSADWRCLTCYELEQLEGKQQKQDDKLPLPFPENYKGRKKIYEKKLSNLDDVIEALQEQKEELKQKIK